MKTPIKREDEKVARPHRIMPDVITKPQITPHLVMRRQPVRLSDPVDPYTGDPDLRDIWQFQQERARELGGLVIDDLDSQRVLEFSSDNLGLGDSDFLEAVDMSADLGL